MALWDSHFSLGKVLFNSWLVCFGAISWWQMNFCQLNIFSWQISSSTTIRVSDSIYKYVIYTTFKKDVKRNIPNSTPILQKPSIIKCNLKIISTKATVFVQMVFVFKFYPAVLFSELIKDSHTILPGCTNTYIWRIPLLLFLTSFFDFSPPLLDFLSQPAPHVHNNII